MQVNNNINTMIQLEKKLEQSAYELSKLGLNSEQPRDKKQKTLQENKELGKNDLQEVDLTNEMIKQIEIPLVYTANAQVILKHDSINQTVVDIKA